MTADLAASFPTSYAAEWPRVVGATLRAFGDLELAEDSAQEAFLRAAERLTAGESIDNIGAWATTAARRIAIDALRRDGVLRARLPLLLRSESPPESAAEDRLGLIFVACDPVLSAEQQVAMALRIVCGVPTADIADFFGLPEATVAARLTRARKAIARSGTPFRWPGDADREARRGQVLTTIYGIYTLGHTAPRGSDLVDARLSELALSLATTVGSEYPADTEVLGLRALIVLGEARRPARTGADGMPFTLAEVDRSAWGQQRIREGGDPLVQDWTEWVEGPGEHDEPAGTTSLGWGPLLRGGTLTIPILATRVAPGPIVFDLQILNGENDAILRSDGAPVWVQVEVP